MRNAAQVLRAFARSYIFPTALATFIAGCLISACELSFSLLKVK